MGLRVSVHPAAYLCAALAVLTLPLRWWLGAVLAAVIHELAHICAVRFLGGRILGLTVTTYGAVLHAESMERAREVAASAAGPLGSFCAVLFARYYPEMAVWALAQGVYNLLPVYPLDGGRMARCLFPAKVCRCLEALTILGSAACGLWLYKHSSLSIASFFPVVMLLLHLPRKLSCKESNLAVQ